MGKAPKKPEGTPALARAEKNQARQARDEDRQRIRTAAMKCFEDKGLGENYILATTCGKDKLEVVISAMFYRGCL